MPGSIMMGRINIMVSLPQQLWLGNGLTATTNGRAARHCDHHRITNLDIQKEVNRNISFTSSDVQNCFFFFFTLSRERPRLRRETFTAKSDSDVSTQSGLFEKFEPLRKNFNVQAFEAISEDQSFHAHCVTRSDVTAYLRVVGLDSRLLRCVTHNGPPV